jgi:hypothetical protein
MEAEIVQAFSTVRAAINGDTEAEPQHKIIGLAALFLAEVLVRDLHRIANAQQTMAEAYVKSQS